MSQYQWWSWQGERLLISALQALYLPLPPSVLLKKLHKRLEFVATGVVIVRTGEASGFAVEMALITFSGVSLFYRVTRGKICFVFTQTLRLMYIKAFNAPKYLLVL